MSSIDDIIKGKTDPISAMEVLESEQVSLLPTNGKQCFGVGSVTEITEKMFKNFAEHVKEINYRMGRDSGREESRSDKLDVRGIKKAFTLRSDDFDYLFGSDLPLTHKGLDPLLTAIESLDELVFHDEKEGSSIYSEHFRNKTLTIFPKLNTLLQKMYTLLSNFRIRFELHSSTNFLLAH